MAPQASAPCPQATCVAWAVGGASRPRLHDHRLCRQGMPLLTVLQGKSVKSQPETSPAGCAAPLHGSGGRGEKKRRRRSGDAPLRRKRKVRTGFTDVPATRQLNNLKLNAIEVCSRREIAPGHGIGPFCTGLRVRSVTQGDIGMALQITSPVTKCLPHSSLMGRPLGPKPASLWRQMPRGRKALPVRKVLQRRES